MTIIIIRTFCEMLIMLILWIELQCPNFFIRKIPHSSSQMYVKIRVFLHFSVVVPELIFTNL